MRCAARAIESPYESSADFAKYAMKLREQALLKVEPQVFVPTTFAHEHAAFSVENEYRDHGFLDWRASGRQQSRCRTTKSSWDAELDVQLRWLR